MLLKASTNFIFFFFNDFNFYSKVKKNIKVLEDELQRAQPLMFSTISIDPVEFEPQTLAILQGHLVKYLILSKEVIILNDRLWIHNKICEYFR